MKKQKRMNLTHKMEYVALDDVFLPHRTRKEVDDDHIKKVAASIYAFGFDQPIVVCEAGEILKGQVRHMAAEKLGMTHVPVIRISHLSEQELIAMRIADNKTHQRPWKIPDLVFDFQTLSRSNFNLSLTGFSESEVEFIMNMYEHSLELKVENEGVVNESHPMERKHLLVVEVDEDSEAEDLFEELFERGYFVERQKRRVLKPFRDDQ